jgi:hypothetical protein
MKHILILFGITALLLAGCSLNYERIVADQKADIKQLLGSCEIKQVEPPVGPFDINNRESLYFYYEVKVYKTGKVYWVESSPSLWSGLQGPNYKFYTQTLGVYYRVFK